MTSYIRGTWYNFFKGKDPVYHANEPGSPMVILDDLGMEHEREIPPPGVYRRKRCKCGILHTWKFEGDQSFELGKVQISDREIPLKKCKTCKETLVLELEQPEE